MVVPQDINQFMVVLQDINPNNQFMVLLQDINPQRPLTSIANISHEGLFDQHRCDALFMRTGLKASENF